MDTSFERAQTLAALRAELPGLEGSAISVGGAASIQSKAPAGAESLGILGTSIEDLARLHEQHGATMRHFAAAVPPPVPSSEPMLGAARLRGSGPGAGPTGLPPRPAFDRPLMGSGGAPSSDTVPMQRSSGERKLMAESANARAERATEARYAAEAAEVRARVEAAQAKQVQRSEYLMERDSINQAQAQAAMAAAAARVAQAPPPSSTMSLGGSVSARATTSARPASASFTAGGSASARTSTDPAPVAPLRMPIPLDRPTSAPKERPRVTVPQPFSFEHRPKKDSAAERRMRKELEEERKSLEFAQKTTNKARDLPPTTAPGLYSEMVAEAEAASKERRQHRRTVPVPFSFTHRQTRSAKQLSELEEKRLKAEQEVENLGDSANNGLWTEKGEMVGTRKSFRARDVPRSMSEPRWEMMRLQEAERRERVAQEAMKSMHRSKLPPRMQQHKETERAKKAAEAERIQAEIDQELTLKPNITHDVPDFDRLHLNFEKELARKRNTFKSTTPQPFRMESEPYRMMQREVKQVRDEMIQRDIRRDELVMPERRWPYLSTQAPIGRKPIPDFPKAHAVVKSKMPENAMTTLKGEAIAAKTAKDRQDRAKMVEKEKKEENKRQQAQKDITKKVATRLGEVAGDMKDVRKKQEEEWTRRKEEHAEAWRERKKAIKSSMDEMRARIEARPFLFEQASIDVQVERAKQEAHERFEKTLKKHGLADRLDPA